MNKEREFKELKKLVLEGCFYYSESELGYDEDEVVKSIQDKGYTKHPFDVEELKFWIKGLYLNNNSPGEIRTIDIILKRIREIEEGR